MLAYTVMITTFQAQGESLRTPRVRVPPTPSTDTILKPEKSQDLRSSDTSQGLSVGFNQGFSVP